MDTGGTNSTKVPSHHPLPLPPEPAMTQSHTPASRERQQTYSRGTRVVTRARAEPRNASRGVSVLPDREKGILERIYGAAKGLESHLSTVQRRNHRFPHHLREIGGAGDRYVVPSVVAIGPYHHGLPHLQPMEEVKLAAADKVREYFVGSFEEAYHKVFFVIRDARRCYDAPVVSELSNTEFAAMMFLDGCFLLWLIMSRSNNDDEDRRPESAITTISLDRNDKLRLACARSFGPNLLKDIFLLENQIPWLVLEVLMELSVVKADHVISWLFSNVTRVLFARVRTRIPPWSSIGDMKQPRHLLDLLRIVLIHGGPRKVRKDRDGGCSSLFISAVHLAQIGVKLTTSKARWFADMNIQKKPFFFGELSLSPMLMNDIVACYLINLVALEVAEATTQLGEYDDDNDDGYVVSSYVSMLAMLMDREEDVHQLRRRGVLNSSFSNAHTLAFFKGLAQHLRLGDNYRATMDDIDAYIRQRPVRTAVHKFFYNNYKVIAAILSIAGVLFGILKALYSLKKA